MHLLVHPLPILCVSIMSTFRCFFSRPKSPELCSLSWHGTCRSPVSVLVAPFCLQFPPSTKNFQEAQSYLNQAAAGLNQSANELVQASRGTPQDLAKASGKFGQDFSEFLQAGVEMAGQSPVSTSAGRTCRGGGGEMGQPVRRVETSLLLLRWALHAFATLVFWSRTLEARTFLLTHCAGSGVWREGWGGGWAGSRQLEQARGKKG